MIRLGVGPFVFYAFDDPRFEMDYWKGSDVMGMKILLLMAKWTVMKMMVAAMELDIMNPMMFHQH